MEPEIGTIEFKSSTPYGCDENFTLTFEYNADEGLTIRELRNMCRSFAAAYGFLELSIKKYFGPFDCDDE